jgi:hypothetical protein
MRQFLRRNKEDVWAYSLYVLFFIFLGFLCTLQGCGVFSSAPVIHQMADADSWEIPVLAQKFEVGSLKGEGGSGKQDDAPDMVITVPASDKPTVVEVRKVKRTIIDKTLTNKPEFAVKSDSQGVTAAQPKQTVWWKWIAAGVGGLFLLAMVVMIIVNKVSNWSPWGFLLRLFKRS